MTAAEAAKRTCKCGHAADADHYLAVICSECPDDEFCWSSEIPKLDMETAAQLSKAQTPARIARNMFAFMVLTVIGSISFVGVVDAVYDAGNCRSYSGCAPGTSNGAHIIQHWPTYTAAYWWTKPHPTPDPVCAYSADGVTVWCRR